MLDTAIVGGGLCGLALACDLERQGRQYAVFEARNRLGGRILSVPSEVTGARLDLGPTWYWPHIHPQFTRLVAELGLISFAQHDTGDVLAVKDAEGKLDHLGGDPVHNGAMRVEGGMAAVIDALIDRLPTDRLFMSYVLVSVQDRGTHVDLHFRVGDQVVVIEARQVVLTAPPRVLAEQINFDPALDSGLREAMEATPTWMAGEAKMLAAYRKAFWRDQGLSGNGFARHEQAVLGELFDACDSTGAKAAVGGFVALSADYREAFRVGMPMLVRSQLVQFFGADAEHGELHYQDWSTEPYTASQLDRERPDEHPEYAHPALMRPYWDGRLLLGGSETARYGGGYLEGALDAAGRLREQLAQNVPLAPANRAGLEEFEAWVNAQRAQAFDRYQKHLHEKLSTQARDQLTQLSLLETVDDIYLEALSRIEKLALDTAAAPVVNGRSDLTPPLLAPFTGFNDALLDSAIQFNRTSCALSNFPAEHQLSPEYVSTIRRDLAAAWRDFALAVNARVLPAKNLRREASGA